MPQPSRSFIALLIAVKTLYAAPQPEAGAATLDEISDNSGKIIRAKVLRITEKEVVYTDTTGTEEKKIPLDNLIFVRSVKGEYRFFFQSESTPPAKPETKTPEIPGELEITAGVGGHFADNNALGDYSAGYGAALATQYNQQVGSGFQSKTTREASALHLQFFAEPRLNYENFILGLSIGYAALPKTSADVSSATAQVQTTVIVEGLFFPVTAMVYYRWISDGALGVNFGIGAGVLYSSVRLRLNGGPADNEQVFTSLNPMLVFKPELTYKFGAVRLLISLPVYWAEGRDVTDGDDTLLKIKSTNIISPNLTGAGIMVAAGIRL